MQLQEPKLRQRGLASVDLLAQMSLASWPIQQMVDADLKQADINAGSLPEVQPAIHAVERGPAQITPDPKFDAPRYLKDVHFHRTNDSWQGHPHMDYIHWEIAHKQMVARSAPGRIFKQRLKVAAMAPKAHYDRILGIGRSRGHFTVVLTSELCVLADRQVVLEKLLEAVGIVTSGAIAHSEPDETNQSQINTRIATIVKSVFEEFVGD